MNDFSGFQPQIGEICALRTFRIGPGGILYPLFNDTAWTDFTNTAQCSRDGGSVHPSAAAVRLHHNASNVAGDLDSNAAPHSVPDTECTCGFYAYATMHAASEFPHAQHVLAVVACWGRVIAGTRGIRAEHARVEAIWMSKQVPEPLQDHLAQRYPSVRVFGDKAQMLAEHPLTVLDCYEPGEGLQRRRRLTALRLALLGAIAIGSLPASWTWRYTDARLLWLAELAFFLLGAVVLRRRRDNVIARGTMLLFAAAALWLIAPFAGAAGTLLLRLPILEITIIGTVHRARLARAARAFPATIARPS